MRQSPPLASEVSRHKSKGEADRPKERERMIGPDEGRRPPWLPGARLRGLWLPLRLPTLPVR